jgi:hypothetical protein
MAFTLEFLEAQGIVSVRTSGTMPLQEFIQLAQEAFPFGAKHGTERFLVDHSDMTPDVNSFDIHELPKILQQLGLAGNVKVAVVYSENSLGKEDFDFYQVSAWSMGINNLRHFTNMQQAMTWLLV